MIKIHGAHGSPFVRKVYIALAYKDIAYEMVHQMPFARDADYEALNPMGRIPTLVDGDLVLGDSKVICRHLENTHPEPPLYPLDKSDRARAEWFEELAGDRLAEYTAGIFFQRFMKPMAFKQEPDEELITKLTTKRLPPLLDFLEPLMPAEGFLFGEFMMADLSIASPFFNASYAGYDVDVEQYPRLSAMIERVKEQPAVAGVLTEEAKMFAGS
ncbi:MAG: glutathione S-transferase family protein [Pseudomonadota bacterium]